MKNYPTLYSRTSTGAIQEWNLFVEDGYYWCVYGQQGGKKIESAKTLSSPKNVGRINATSVFEQAIKEADAIFLKKIEQGGYSEDVNAIDIPKFFSPQLAKNWVDYKDSVKLITGVWCVSPKLDGLRIIQKEMGAYSRNGKLLPAFPHIRDLLEPCFQKYPDLILDGECYQHKLSGDFNKIISLAKKTKPTETDIAESAALLEYWIFDCGSHSGVFSERLKFIKSIVDEVNDPRIKYVDHHIVTTYEQVESFLEDSILQNYEGIMLKRLDSLYQNKRTSDLLKYKLFQEEEFEIVDITEGDGNRSGMFGRATLKTNSGRLFESNARGTIDFYKELYTHREYYIGKYATVRFQNWTPGDNSCPRFPVIVAIRDYE